MAAHVCIPRQCNYPHVRVLTNRTGLHNEMGNQADDHALALTSNGDAVARHAERNDRNLNITKEAAHHEIVDLHTVMLPKGITTASVDAPASFMGNTLPTRTVCPCEGACDERPSA